MKNFNTRHTPGRRLAVSLLGASMIAGALGMAPAAHAVGVYQVGCDTGALSAAIADANLTPNVGGPDIINLAHNCTYKFTSPYLATDDALPIITDDLTIYGNGSKFVRDNHGDDESDDFGVPGFRFLEIGSDFGPDVDATVTVINLTMTGGRIDNTNAFGNTVLAGGAIRVADTSDNGSGESRLNGQRLTLKDNEVVFVDLQTVVGGGAIMNDGGVVDLLQSTVSDNSVHAFGVITIAGGGGIVAADGANGSATRVRRSTVKNNEVEAFAAEAIGAGGGIATSGPDSCLVLDGATVSGNSVDGLSGLATINAGGGLLVAGEDGGTDQCDDGTIGFIENLDFVGTYIRNSVIDKNEVEADSAGLSLSLGGGIGNSALDILGGGGGGAGSVHVDDGDDDDGGSKVTNNKATCNDRGCLSIGGGFAGLGANSVWNKTLFKGNVASAPKGGAVGGGMAALAGHVADLNEAVVTKNTAKGRFATGGGLFADSLSVINIDASDIFKNKPNNCFNVFGC